MPDLWMDVDAALAEVPVNIMPLLDDTDFKSREESVAYNAAGMELIWHFVTTAGATSATVVTPTTGGNYDWAHQDGGMYTIEIPASGGASINNDTEGFGWFTGVATGVLPWRGPVIGFRAAGGLIISDTGGLDADDLKADVTEILTDTGTTLQGKLDGIQADTEDIQTQIGVAGAGLTAVPWNAAWDAEVQSEAADALNAYDPPTKAELDSAVAPLATAAALATVDGIVDDILVDTGTTLDGKIDTIDGIVDDILVDTGTTLDGKIDTIDTAIGALPTATENADEVLTRDWTSVTGEAARSVLNALRFLRNKWSVAGTTLTVTEEDDSTPAWTAALTTNAAADPVTGSDPS